MFPLSLIRDGALLPASLSPDMENALHSDKVGQHRQNPQHHYYGKVRPVAGDKADSKQNDPFRAGEKTHLSRQPQTLSPGSGIAGQHRAGQSGTNQNRFLKCSLSRVVSQQSQKQHRFRETVESGIKEGSELCTASGGASQRTVKKIERTREEHQKAAQKKTACVQHQDHT